MNSSKPFDGTKFRVAIAAICVFYVAVRFWGIADSCLWFDEIFGVHAAELPWGEIFWFLAQDLIHPPLFYILLKVWISIGGESLLWLRLFPLFFSFLSVVPFLLICRELKLERLAIIVAFGLFAVNGALIKYAQEVRMYSLLLFLSLMSIWLFSRFFTKGKSFVALILVNILLVHTHYFGWLVVGSQVVAILAFQRIKIRQMLLMGILTLLSFVPWMVAVYSAASVGSGLGQNIGWIERPGFRSIFDLVFDLFEPFYFQASSVELSSLYYISIPLLLLIAAAKVLYFWNWKEVGDKQKLYILGILAGFPIVLAFAASWIFPYSFWGSRHLTIIYAPVLILAAIFVTGSSSVAIRRIALGALIAFVAASFVFRIVRPSTDYVWCSWEKAAEKIVQTESNDPKAITPIYAFEDLSAYHLWFALRRDQRFRVFKVEGVKGIAEDKAYFLPRGFNGVEKIQIDNVPKQRSFIAFRDSEIDRRRRPLRAFTYRNFEMRRLEMASTAEVIIFLYEVF